jgi:hypothetical protein
MEINNNNINSLPELKVSNLEKLKINLSSNQINTIENSFNDRV